LSNNHLPPLILLLGGKGTRIKDAYPDTPKGLIPVNGINVLDYTIKNYIQSGGKTIVLALGNMANCYIEYVKSQNYNCSILFSIEHQPLGTGGASTLAAQSLPKESYFFIANGDTFNPINFKKAYAQLIENLWDGALYLKSVSNFTDSGQFTFDQHHLITGYSYRHKGSHGFLYSGLCLLKSKIFLCNPIKSSIVSLEELLVKNIESNKLMAVVTEQRFYDIGTPERLAEARVKKIGSDFMESFDGKI